MFHEWFESDLTPCFNIPQLKVVRLVGLAVNLVRVVSMSSRDIFLLWPNSVDASPSCLLSRPYLHSLTTEQVHFLLFLVVRLILLFSFWHVKFKYSLNQIEILEGIFVWRISLTSRSLPVVQTSPLVLFSFVLFQASCHVLSVRSPQEGETNSLGIFSSQCRNARSLML